MTIMGPNLTLTTHTTPLRWDILLPALHPPSKKTPKMFICFLDVIWVLQSLKGIVGMKLPW